jgi:nuclear pore complex protein Nup188
MFVQNFEPDIKQTTKVTVGELATMGTFLELGNGIIDLLQHVKPSTKAKLPVSYTTPPFDSSYDTSILSQSLESIAIFTVSQLAVWQHQRDIIDPGVEDDSTMDWNDIGYGKESMLGRLIGKRAPMLAGLGGDVFNELLGMLSKAKVALAKIEPGADALKGVIAILEAFLNLRVIH